MPDDVHTVVQHAGDFQSAIGGDAIQQEMPGIADTADGAAHAVAAMTQMIGGNSFGQLRTFPCSGA